MLCCSKMTFEPYVQRLQTCFLRVTAVVAVRITALVVGLLFQASAGRFKGHVFFPRYQNNYLYIE